MRFTTTGVVILLAVAISACADSKTQPAEKVVAVRGPIEGLPQGWGDSAQVDSVLKAVKKAQLKNSEFASHLGDDQEIGPATTGWIQPHVNSNDTLKSGMVLARIGVTRDMANHKWHAGDWNYWIAIKFAGHSEFTGLMVNLKAGKADTTSMARRGRPGTHKDVLSRWVPMYKTAFVWAGETAGWTTCDGGDCCCEGKTCGPMPLDSIPPGPPDTTPVHRDSTHH